jgi:hypothetical protein
LSGTVILYLVLGFFAGCLHLVFVEINTLTILVFSIETPGPYKSLQLFSVLAALFRTLVGLCL